MVVDLRLHLPSGGAKDGFAGNLAGSYWGGDWSDYVLVNMNIATGQPYDVGAVKYAGSGAYTAESTATSGWISFPNGTYGPYNLGPNRILNLLEVFLPAGQTGIHLSAGQRARVDTELAVGGVSEAISVTADAPMVATSQAAVGEVLPEEAVRSLPITSRNVYNFHLVGPGVKGRPSTGFGTTQFVVGGADRMQWYMDGIDNTSRNGSRQIRPVIPTPENVEKMQPMLRP